MNKIPVFIVFILLSFLSFQGKGQDSILDQPISINKNNISVDSILKVITDETGIYFSYDATIIVSTRKVSVNSYNKPLKETLSQIFDEHLFNLTEREDHIIITLDENSENPLPDINNEYITISGNIINKRKRNPIQYASISVINSTLGTISNKNGDFILKLPTEYYNDSILISCIGYSKEIIPLNESGQNMTVQLSPKEILIEEITVSPVSAVDILNNVFNNIKYNYSSELIMMKGFYREILQQDKKYIHVSEAILDILKKPYYNIYSNDDLRILKQRINNDFNSVQWVDFKLQGGPNTMTQLDIAKTIETFLDPEYRMNYTYIFDKVIWHLNSPVYVIKFKPSNNIPLPLYEGEMYVDLMTFAILHAEFNFSKAGLKFASESFIKKAPAGFKVTTTKVKYMVDYQLYNGTWFLNSVIANVEFKVKNKKENINSTFTSISELLITDKEKSQIKRFPRKQVFTMNDIFIDQNNEYDESFWGNFNFITPDEDLKEALKGMSFKQLGDT